MQSHMWRFYHCWSEIEVHLTPWPTNFAMNSFEERRLSSIFIWAVRQGHTDVEWIARELILHARHRGIDGFVTADPAAVSSWLAALDAACVAGVVRFRCVPRITGGMSHTSRPDVPVVPPAQASAPLQSSFDDRFKLVDSKTGEALANRGYAIKRDSGAMEHDRSDAQGFTHRLFNAKYSESVEIYVED